MWVRLAAALALLAAVYVYTINEASTAAHVRHDASRAPTSALPRRAPRSVSGSEELPDYHLMMLNDEQRNAAFDGAIRKVVRGQRVLDIGAGTGLLSMMSSRAGAVEITAVERSPLMVGVAHEVLALNNWTRTTHTDTMADFEHAGGYASIRLLRMESTALSIGPASLPQPATVLLSETLDTFLIGEAFIPSLADARRRGLITPDAIIVPARATVSLFPAFSEIGFGTSSAVRGFNLEPMRPHRPFRPRGLAMDAPECVILGPAVQVGVFDFQRDSYPKFVRIIVHVNETTVLNSLVMHWVASIDADGEFQTTNAPRRHRSWAAGLMLLMDDLFVVAGDSVRVDMAIAQTQWAFAARVISEGDASAGLEWRRVVILYESQCATVELDVFWMPPGESKKKMVAVRVVTALQPWASAAGTTYPGHQFEARISGTTTVVARFTAADALENHFVLPCRHT